MKYIFIFLILAAPARAGEFALPLKAAEEAALATSPQYKAALAAAEAARGAAGAAAGPLLPRAALEGSLKYVGTVPEMKVGRVVKPLTDNWNYSLGAAGYYTLYDGGGLRGSSEAARRTALAREAEAEGARRQALLRTRTAYFRLQLSLEKVYLIGENLQLALSQQKDMELGLKAGSRSRLDGLRARQEVTARRRDLLRARVELASALAELKLASGLELKGDVSLPLDARMAGRDYGEIGAGAYIRADRYADLLAALQPAAKRQPDPDLPAAAALERTAEAYRLYAGAAGAELSPKVNIGARTSLDYPNGPNLYSFLQNSAWITASLPLFEGGRPAWKKKELEAGAQAALARRGDALRAAGKEFSDAKNSYEALAEEQALNLEASEDAAEAAKLTYDAYQAGGAAWLEVESANLKALQAKTAAATTNTEILMKLALLDSLAAQER